jgi:hypothetical protein
VSRSLVSFGISRVSYAGFGGGGSKVGSYSAEDDGAAGQGTQASAASASIISAAPAASAVENLQCTLAVRARPAPIIAAQRRWPATPFPPAMSLLRWCPVTIIVVSYV